MQKKSETLSQRENAQRELINLKKMKQGEISTETLKKEEKIEPKTFLEKAAHFFYYQKYKILAGIVAVIALFVIFYNMVIVPDYDGKVTIYCYEYVSPEDITAIEGWIKEYYPDTNGNGKVDILATDCSFSLDTDQKSYVDNMMLKVQSLLASEKDAMLFILDAQSLEYLKSISKEFLLFEPADVVALPESFYDALPKDRTTLNETKTRYICLRRINGTALDGKKAQTFYNSAKEVIEKLK